MLEEGFDVDVCLVEGEMVKGILGINIPPNKNHPIIKIEDLNYDYDFLVLPGGVKSMEKVRLEKIIDLIRVLTKKKLL